MLPSMLNVCTSFGLGRKFSLFRFASISTENNVIWSVFYASASNLGFPFPELLFSSIDAVRFERIEGGCLRELDSKLGFVFLDRLV